MAIIAQPISKRVRPPKAVYKIAGCDDTESWSGGSVSYDQYHVHPRGNKNDPVELGSTGSLNTTVLSLGGTFNFNRGKWYQIDVYVRDYTLLDGIAVYLSNDGGTTNIASKTFTEADYNNGWHTLIWHEDEWTYSGDFVVGDLAKVQAAILGVDSASGQTTTVDFQNFYNVERKAEFSWEVDDGIKTVTDEMAGIVNDEYSYPFSFYAYTSFIGVDANYATWAELAAFQAAGNVMGIHNHLIGNFVTASSTEAQIRADWEAAIDLFVANNIDSGPGGRFHYAASNGAVAGPAEILQREYFLTSRRNSYPASFGLFDIPANPNDLFGYIYRPSISLNDYKGFIDNAVNEQRAIAIVGHYMRSIDPTDQNDLSITPADLREILDYVQAYERQGVLDYLDRDDYLADYQFRINEG